MHWLLCLIALISFVIYTMAIRSLFSRDHGVDVRMKVWKVVGLFSALTHLGALAWFTDSGVVQSMFALSAYASGLAIFFAARREILATPLTLAFSPDQPEHLVSSGIYRWIRHPFYTAYALTWLGGVVASPNLLTVVPAAAMLTLYFFAAHYEEAKFEASSLSQAYVDYRERTGMFWPYCKFAFRIKH